MPGNDWAAAGPGWAEGPEANWSGLIQRCQQRSAGPVRLEQKLRGEHLVKGVIRQAWTEWPKNQKRCLVTLLKKKKKPVICTEVNSLCV